MLWIILILLVLWALGVFSAIGSLIHALLVIALILFIVDMINRRRATRWY